MFRLEIFCFIFMIELFFFVYRNKYSNVLDGIVYK